MIEPKYTIIMYTPQELNHSSYIQTGLFELEQAGVIKVKVVLTVKRNLGRLVVSKEGDLKASRQAHPKTSFYKLIVHGTKKELLFATDLYDFVNHFSTAALETCDFIFKRNYESTYIQHLPERFRSKIHPLGFTFGVHSEFHRNKNFFFLGLLLSNLNVHFKLDRLFFNRLNTTYRTQVIHWKFIKKTRNLDRFEGYEPAVKDTVLFQTRCFLHENEEDVKAIHLQRYRIIKLLRKEFPNHFLGGFVPSSFSKDHYGDAITNVPSEPERYLDVLKRAKIVIYTRGLANSPAWKMPEYLSQGKVIIAERLTVELPVPLIHGKEVLFFDAEEELVANISEVLKNKELANFLSTNARTYFEKHIHPVQNTKRILEFMLNKTLD